jgi:hygromycin-B 7''-O-kinase
MLLPLARTAEEYRAVDLRNPAHQQAVAEICRRHGIAAEGLNPFPGGSSIVYAVGADVVIKLYPPVFADECRVETEVLRRIDGALSVPVPRPLASGELEGWGYLVMTRLRGRELPAVWPEIPHDERLGLGRQLGRLVRELHLLPVDTVPLPDVWGPFLDGQIAGCPARHAKLGLPERLLEQIPAFLDTQAPALRRPGPRALLHTEVMPDHLLAEQGPSGWALTGLYDFEPAMIGEPEYEFAAVGLFFSMGDAGLLTSFLEGYGYPAGEERLRLPERIMAHTLLHRYSNLVWYLKFMPEFRSGETFDTLARRWFGLEVRG